MFTHQLSREEHSLISAIRESKTPPTAVMIGTRNVLYKDNKNGRWNELIEIWDRYIEEYLDFDNE